MRFHGRCAADAVGKLVHVGRRWRPSAHEQAVFVSVGEQLMNAEQAIRQSAFCSLQSRPDERVGEPPASGLQVLSPEAGVWLLLHAAAPAGMALAQARRITGAVVGDVWLAS